ncbi:acetyl-CoA C-acyltransferase FadI [Ectothiorhodospira shaposhnikovii]|uniref:acetyl-CoA C-acyltransferase FadI n=1 Tax=Ectothiorhodospira shaposhnikovii TaxID=1054 RepID=UPI001908A9E8|nr:acetyl-CoA C-acyltransferase FadI [Ectothiorhodospira shaposhnikovii]MBK1674257.1 acetyl-CoA C-acyltransferase FadI [Ectothiorhodospira shaposhnikovii]
MKKTPNPAPTRPGQRVAVVAGLRTPFARQLTAFRDLSAIDLGILVTSELMARTDLDPALVERVVYGQVGILPQAPNIAREVVLGAGLPAGTDAYSVSRACATSLQSTVDVAAAIARNEIQVGLAGGADSTSVLPLQLSTPLARAFMRASKARSLLDKLRCFKDIRPGHLLPNPPAVADYSTGLRMGDIAEQMARNHDIGRAEQDALAVASHHKAHQAWEAGHLQAEVMTGIVPPFREVITRDNTLRPDTSLEHMARLPPVFDRRHGTVTAANSSPLTDGAVSLLLMTESRARALGFDPLGFIRGWAFTAIDPFNDGLMGPSHATPLALDRAGIRLQDLALVEMHEAFAAQVLANLKQWRCPRFAREVLGRDTPIGEVDPDRFNVLGGSIAYGHPFAATGGRMIIQTLRELRRRGGGLALTTACAAGGLGAALILEVN